VAVFITNFTEDLVNEGLVQNILDLLTSLNWINEMAALQKNMALGDPKHRYQVHELFRGIQRGLADCVFALAAQSGLRKTDTIKLMDYLSRVRLEQGNSDGSLEEVTMSLLLALLYALEIARASKNSITNMTIADDYTAQFGQKLPMLSDSTFLPSIHREITSSSSRQWHHDGIYSLVRFTWAMSLAFLRSQPPTESGFNAEQNQAVIDDDEVVYEASLEMGVFHWMSKCILVNQTVLKQEEFYVRRIHQLLTDLIVFMPLKVKDLRNRADDAARNKMMHEHEGIQYSVPLSGKHF
jgi:nuclear pore complex protein Nup205